MADTLVCYSYTLTIETLIVTTSENVAIKSLFDSIVLIR